MTEITQATATEATTTAEQQRITAGQRKINLVWEVTQAVIAVTVTAAVIFAAVKGIKSEILGNAFTLIIAIYFVRMNHTKIGGVSAVDSR